MKKKNFFPFFVLIYETLLYDFQWRKSFNSWKARNKNN